MNEIIQAITQSKTILTLTICLAVTAVLAITLLVLVIRLYKKYNAFMGGSDSKSLEENIKAHLDEIDSLKIYSEDVRKHLKRIDSTLAKAYQKSAFRKYDAFEGLGGHLSFSLCLLDAGENGFILSSMHTREGCYTYIKDIIKGESVVLLSDEEKNTLTEAKSGQNIL